MEKNSILQKQILREAMFYNIVPLIDMLTVHEDTSDLKCAFAVSTFGQTDDYPGTLDDSYRSTNVVLSNNCLTAMNIGEGHAYVLGTTVAPTEHIEGNLMTEPPSNRHTRVC